MSIWALAFFTGLFGSVHCLGMCGPLAFAVPSVHSNRGLILFDKLMYQFGRIISYSALGILAGFIGRQLWLSGLQQSLSIVCGVLVIIAAVQRLFKYTIASNAGSVFLKPFNKLFGYLLKNKANHLFIGMLNGLLPCGFVYLALAGAVNTGDVKDSTAYMFLFGLGTLPLMLIAAFSMGIAAPSFRRRVNRFIPYLMIVLGCWFVLKGLTLDIPYLSPSRQIESGVCK
ncbi:sulfite exporter TauE/SafE family protein [Arcticibacter tournemirensis]